MRTAICPGSYDPITLGHLNIIRRASRLFDRVIVCAMKNPSKTNPMFSDEEKLDMIRKATARFGNVEAAMFDGLLTDFAKKYENPVIVKGLRAVTDFEYEFQMSLINRKLSPELETVFLTSSDKYTFLSSSIVREMAHYGVPLDGFVPYEIIEDIERKASQLK